MASAAFPAAARIEASVAGMTVHGARGEILSAPRFDAVNSFASPEVVRPKPFTGVVKDGRAALVIPAKSVVVVAID